MSDLAKCKLCRRAGEKLFLRGERCFTPKCAFERKPYAPGRPMNERKRRSNISEYGMQLREKQKVRNMYRVNEKQFSRYVAKAMASHGINPAEKLYEELESRLDSVAFRMGLAASRAQARQLVSHGHLLVNGRRVDIPSYNVRPGDVVTVRDTSKGRTYFAQHAEKLKDTTAPTWIKFDAKKMEATMQGAPKLEQEQVPYNLTSVMEFYSR